MTRLWLLALLIRLTAFAQKKPITLETLNQGGGRGGRGGGPVNWAPDGKTFVFRQGQSLRIYDPATKGSKELISTEALDAAAVKPPARIRPVRLDQPANARRRRCSGPRTERNCCTNRAAIFS